MFPAIKIRSLVATGVKHTAFDFISPAGRNANRQAGLKSKNVTLQCLPHLTAFSQKKTINQLQV